MLYACGGDGPADDGGDTVGTTDALTTGVSTETDPTGSGGPIPGCDGVELEQDGVLDLDIAVVEYVVVSGSIRVNGGALPDADGSRGSIVFETTPTKGSPGVVTYTLGDTGPENYSVVLPAGSVTVRYTPDAGVCAASPEGPLPCSSGTLVAAAALLDSGVLDLDIPSVTVSGNVRQNGETLPDDADERGHLEFTRAAGDLAATAGFGPDGPATYAIALFPDTYHVHFVGNPALCAEGPANVPCNRGEVQHGVNLQNSGVLDLDVPKVDVSGVVHVNGAPVPDSTVDRGAIRVRPSGVEGADALQSPAFGATGPVNYALSLVAGTYDVELAANPAQCDGEPPVIPCIGGVVVSGVKLVSSGVLDVDVPMIEVSGAVTLRGAALPDTSADRGSVLFARGELDGTSVALGTSDPVDYLLGLIPGQYTTRYVTDGAQCDGDTAPPMPCVGGPLQTLELATSGVLDVDIPAVEISGAVTLNGAALESQPTSRGSLQFMHDAGSSVAVPLGSDDAVDYAVTVLPGEYDVAHVTDGACVGPPEDLMPCGGGRLLANIPVANDGVLDVDIPAISVSGAITYATMALPDLQQSRGALRWSRLDGGSLTIDLGPDGGVEYDLLITPGRWVVDHAANPELCEDGVPGFPCTDQNIIGCDGP